MTSMRRGEVGYQEQQKEVNSPRGRFHPYLIIEDAAMKSLRKESKWAYKDMSPELLDPLINEHRNWIYHLGVTRILLRLCQGYNSFKLDSGGGLNSFRYAVENTLSPNGTSSANNRYRFYPKGEALEKDKAAMRYGYSIKKRPRLGSIARYIGRDKFKEYERRLGRDDDPYLFLNYDFAADLIHEYRGDDKMEIKLQEWQEDIIKDLSMGRDFILYPYGVSLHYMLSLMTARKGKYYSRFRFCRIV